MNGTLPRITFAIPYFQNLNQLSFAIQSLVAQTCINWVAIVLDDRGGEDAEKLVMSFNDERIEYHRNETNLGLAENWNKGIALAQSEFVCIFHADDVLMPNYVETLLQLMDKHPNAVAGHCRAKIIGETGNSRWSLPDEFKKLIRPRTKAGLVTSGEVGLSSIIGGSWIFCPTLCYRKSELKAFKFQRQWKFVVDIDFICQILLDGGFLVGSKTNAYKYRRHNTSQTSVLTKSLERFVEESRFLDGLSQTLCELGWKKCLKRCRRRIRLRMHLLYRTLRYVLDWDLVMARIALDMVFRGRNSSSKRAR
jgi:glycosyltransferase involved in cell wall biosynthesis